MHPLLWILAVVGILSAGVWGLRLSADRSVRQTWYDRDVQGQIGSLRQIAVRQEQYEATRRAYWREDVANLLRPWGETASETAPSPLAGLLFRPFAFADEVAPEPKRYAVLLYPPDPRTHEFMYVLTHEKLIWRKRAVAGGIQAFPASPAADGWVPLPP